ncbi:MAG: extracellular solute-binding protein [Oscillospiraceae bacterium]|nr:extracellular solute-binding protein [Oscillospiraceae bacterium]
MKKHTKQILSLLLALVMVVGLCACGKTGGTSSEQPDDGAPKKLTVGLTFKSNVISYDDNALTKYLEDKLNIDLEFVFFSSTAAEAKTQLSTMVAGGEKLPDVMFGISLTDVERNTYGDDGYFVDLAPYFDDPDWELAKEYQFHENLKKYAGEQTYNRALYEPRSPKGALYSWPASCASYTDQPIAHTYINTVWLDKLGLEMPTTYEELKVVLEAFKTQDPNGNGQPDEIPMIGTNHNYNYIDHYIMNNFGEYVNDRTFYNVDDNGKVYIPYTTDEYRDGLRALRELVDAGYLSTLTWTIASSSELNPLWTPADGVAKLGVVAGHITLRTDASSEIVKEYNVLPPLEGSYAPIMPLSISKNYFITTDCEDFDTAAHFLMEFSTLETARRTRHGEPGVDWDEVINYSTQTPMVRYRDGKNPYAGQTSSTWGVVGPFVGNYNEGSPWAGGANPNPPDPNYVPTPGEWRGEMLGAVGQAVLAAAEENNPAVTYIALSYTEDEIEENGAKYTEIYSYVRESRAQFATGALDIDDDATWAKYCKTIEDLGIATLLKTTQAVYDRQK